MNGAGPECKSLEEVERLARSAVSAIMVGSITVAKRPGNPGNVYYNVPGVFSLNSLGLPCRGREYYYENLPEMARLARDVGKPLFVSIAGFSPVEYGELAELVLTRGGDLLEINLGCPNIWSGSGQKQIACFDMTTTQIILQKVEDVCVRYHKHIPVAVKVSPFTDSYRLAELANFFAHSPLIVAVTATNTLPNAFAFNERGASAISPELSGGLAGLAGPALKQIALGQVMQWKQLLPKHIDVIGVGGICLGEDVRDYLQIGASAVQIATEYANRGPRVFSEILHKYLEL